MGQLRVQQAAALVLAGLLAVAGIACQGSKGPEMIDAGRSFPLPAETDFVVRIGPGTPRPDVRQLTIDLARRDGVLASEAHYDAGEIRVVVSRDMSVDNRRRFRSDLLELPAVVGVEVEPPED
jgi:hypothetical protein